MKTLLSIGYSKWVARDAATAAKVADLLGGMTAVNEHYSEASGVKEVLTPAPVREHRHEIIIEAIEDSRMLTAKEFAKWQAQHCLESSASPSP